MLCKYWKWNNYVIVSFIWNNVIELLIYIIFNLINMFVYNYVIYYKGNILLKLLVKIGVVIVYVLLILYLVIIVFLW